MEEKINDYLSRNKQLIENALYKNIDKLHVPTRLKDSMLYSIRAGGKKFRPTLLIASYEAYNDNVNRALSTAVALEMIHTYSLIHDDLPAMDDDDVRRGKPTNHIKFDEATAILAGDALLTYSFQLITEDSLLSDEEKVLLVTQLTSKSGPSGMVAGQVLDIDAENKSVSLVEMEEIHSLKTGALLEFAVLAGAYLAGATKDEITQLKKFAYYLGLIFQVQDDILDVSGDALKVGKPIGSDEVNQKSTYPRLLGLEGAIKQKEIYVEKAKDHLAKANATNTQLYLLTDYLTQRDH